MLELPDYFFRVREIGRLRQTMCSFAVRVLRVLASQTLTQGERVWLNCNSRVVPMKFSHIHIFYVRSGGYRVQSSELAHARMHVAVNAGLLVVLKNVH